MARTTAAKAVGLCVCVWGGGVFRYENPARIEAWTNIRTCDIPCTLPCPLINIPTLTHVLGCACACVLACVVLTSCFSGSGIRGIQGSCWVSHTSDGNGIWSTRNSRGHGSFLQIFLFCFLPFPFFYSLFLCVFVCASESMQPLV
jgi:hypothetical protein